MVQQDAIEKIPFTIGKVPFTIALIPLYTMSAMVFLDWGREDEGLVNVRVLLFAGARELAGTGEGLLTGMPPLTDQQHLVSRVTETFSLRPMAGSFILALNQDYVMPGDRVELRDGDELAVIPPLSGG